MNLFEDPTPIIIAGGIVQVILVVAFWRTGRGIFLMAMVGVLLACGVGVVVERIVVTERERVEQTLDDAAAAVLTNRYDNIATYIAPDAANVQRLAHWGLDRVEFRSVNLTRTEITLDMEARPPTAHVKIKGNVRFKDRSGTSPYDFYPLDGSIDMRLEGDRWLTTNYEMKQNPMRP